MTDVLSGLCRWCSDRVRCGTIGWAAGTDNGGGPVQVYGSDELVKWCAFVFVFAWTAGPNCESTK